VAYIDLTYDVPANLDYDTLANDEEDQCDLISFEAVNDTPIEVNVWVRRRNGQAVFDRSLPPTQTFTDSAPFPGNFKTLADIRSVAIGPGAGHG
jgi:hypothetical protein